MDNESSGLLDSHPPRRYARPGQNKSDAPFFSGRAVGLVTKHFPLGLSDECPDGWTEFDGFCYNYDEEREVHSLTEAVSVCEKLDADVLVINSREENEFVKDLVPSAWLGMRYSYRERGYREWKLLDGKDPLFNLVESWPISGYYHGDICVIVSRDERVWELTRCNFGVAPAVCKQPVGDR